MDEDRSAALRATALRAAMVQQQLRARGIADERVLTAMGSVPRELFVPAQWSAQAYSDGALPIEAGQTISQPYMVALMTELLAPYAAMRVLEIGTGSGYQAAVLATIGCRVLSIERHAGLAETARARLAGLGLSEAVRIEVGDGSVGSPANAPFDGIIVTAAAPRVPSVLAGQLADGGRLVIPVGPPRHQRMRLVTRNGEAYTDVARGDCVFVPLIGEAGFHERPAWAGRWFGRGRIVGR